MGNLILGAYCGLLVAVVVGIRLAARSRARKATGDATWEAGYRIGLARGRSQASRAGWISYSNHPLQHPTSFATVDEFTHGRVVEIGE